MFTRNFISGCHPLCHNASASLRHPGWKLLRCSPPFWRRSGRPKGVVFKGRPAGFALQVPRWVGVTALVLPCWCLARRCPGSCLPFLQTPYFSQNGLFHLDRVVLEIVRRHTRIVGRRGCFSQAGFICRSGASVLPPSVTIWVLIVICENVLNGVVGPRPNNVLALQSVEVKSITSTLLSGLSWF